MRIAICDDEYAFVSIIENYISRLSIIYKNLDFDGFYSGDDLLKQYTEEKNPYDIIFLDMEMHGYNGIETAKKLRELDANVLIIYITNYKEYVFDCFEVNPFRFLVKPINFEDFSNIFSLAYYKVLKNNKPFYFTTKGTTIRLYCEQIIYFESNKRKVIVHTKDSQYEYYAKLGNILKELEGFDFIYAHKSFLVNMNYIQEIKYDSMKLSNGMILPISESKRKFVHKEYLNFLTRSYRMP